MTTIVSCYYLLPNNKKRSIESYMIWISYFLAYCSSPIVMFSDGPIADEMDAFRKSTGLPWLLVRTPLADLDFGEDKYFEALTKGRQITPDVIRIWMNKSVLLNKVAQQNPFNTDSFIWCDAGCWRNETFAKIYAPGWPRSPPKAFSCSWIGNSLENIKGVPPLINPSLEEFVEYYIQHIVGIPTFTGGIYGGDKEAVKTFAEIFRQIFDICKSKNMLIDGDQEISGISVLWMEAQGIPISFYDTKNVPPGTDNWFVLQSLI